MTVAVALPADGSRISLDRYYTRPGVAAACVAAVHALEPVSGVAWEPHVGGRAFAEALQEQTGAQLLVSDIDPRAPGLTGWTPSTPERYAPISIAGSTDFLTTQRSVDWIGGNCPYTNAVAHVAHANDCAERVFFLLRIAFAEGQGRTPFWRQYPARHIWMLNRRPPFAVGGGTGRYAYGLFFWDRVWTEQKLAEGLRPGEPGFTTCTPCWDWRRQPVRPHATTTPRASEE